MGQNISFNGSTEIMIDDKKFEIRNDVPLYFRIISAVEILVLILSLFTLCALIKSHLSASAFVIHLILSDLIQISCMLMTTIDWPREMLFPVIFILGLAHSYSLMVGLYFMACVAFERYLLVSHPIWYKSHRSLKVSCGISVIVWIFPLIFMFCSFFNSLSVLIGYFIPYPIIILCFVGTCRGLSHAISLTSLKRKMILGRLFLVLLTYTFLILPILILSLIVWIFPMKLSLLVELMQFISHLMPLYPLADCILYLFMRPDAADLMKSVCCCCSCISRDEHSRDSRATFTCCVSVQNCALQFKQMK